MIKNQRQAYLRNTLVCCKSIPMANLYLTKADYVNVMVNFERQASGSDNIYVRVCMCVYLTFN